MGKVEKRRQRRGRRRRQDARGIRKRMERRRLMGMKWKTMMSRRSNSSRVGFLMVRIVATNSWKLTTHLCHDQNRQEEEERLALQLLRVYSYIIKGREALLACCCCTKPSSNQRETNRPKLPPSVCKTCNKH
jgi:hypothetical protein